MERRVSYRMEKVNAEMQKTLSSIINSEIENPLLDDEVITVASVETAPDFSVAKVYVSAFNAKCGKETLVKELEESEGFIKKRIAEELRFKRTPALRFVYDDTIEEGNRIMQLIDSLKKNGDINE